MDGMDSWREPRRGGAAGKRRRPAMARPFTVLCAALAWAVAMAEGAQEAPVPEEEAPAQQDATPAVKESEAPPAPDAPVRDATTPNPDEENEPAEVFTPSENISEDISVPFPVDI